MLALQRLGNGAAASAGLETEISVAKARSTAVDDDACSESDVDYEPKQAVGDDPSFSDCDIVSVVMANNGKKPLDVTVLLVGADFSITPVWPQNGASSRILAAESKTADILQMAPNPPAAAEERLIFVAVPGVGKANVVFDNLEQEGLRAAPDDPPEIAAMRELVATGLTDMSRGTAATTKAIDEELVIDVKPYRVVKRAP